MTLIPSGKLPKNWRTTTCGIVVALAQSIMISPDVFPKWAIITAHFVNAAAIATGFAVSADGGRR